MNVLGLGTAAIDVVLQCSNLPKTDCSSIIKNEQIVPGGSCANVLSALSKLDVTTALINKLGDDIYSDIFIKDLKKNNISTDFLKIDSGGTILHTYITVTDNGEKCIFANFGKSSLSLSPNDVNESMLDGVSVFYTDMFPGKPALKLARLCKSKNIKVVFNLQSSPELMNSCGVTSEELEEMIHLSDLFLGCSEGFWGFSNCTDHEKAAKTIYNKFKPSLGVIATQGANGSIWIDKVDSTFQPSFNVNAIDTTGAGDSFIAGIIYSYLLKGFSKKDSLSFASACAAIKCTQLGGRLNTSLNSVLSFIDSNVI